MKFLLPLIVFLACLISPNTGVGQSLSKKEVESAISTIAKLIDDHYVFPEKGKRIATHLLQQYKKGEFSQIKDWNAFDSVITKSLRIFSHDGHLYVRNDPKTVKELLAAKTQTTDSSSTEQFSY